MQGKFKLISPKSLDLTQLLRRFDRALALCGALMLIAGVVAAGLPFLLFGCVPFVGCPQ